MESRSPAGHRQGDDGRATNRPPARPSRFAGGASGTDITDQPIEGGAGAGRVPTDDGQHDLQMAVRVEPHGRLGRLYLTAIEPFRHLIVAVPTLGRERACRNRNRPRLAGGPAGRPATQHEAVPPPRSPDLDQPCQTVPRHEPRPQLITWGGRLMAFYGAAHTVGALTAEGAARHAGVWFSGELWSEDLSTMSPAMSAYWLSVNSFGPPTVLIGLTVLWLDRRGITPPTFIAWAIGGWVLVNTVAAGPGIGQDVIILTACGLLVAGARRAARRTSPVPSVAERHAGR